MTTMTETRTAPEAPEAKVRHLKPEELSEAGYGYLCRLWEPLRRRVLFTLPGLNRFMHVAGWIQGIRDAGSIADADRLASDFCDQLMRLAWSRDVMVPIEGSTLGCQDDDVVDWMAVPANKVVLGDDGGLHSFTFASYTPLSRDVWQPEFSAALDKYNWRAAEEAAAGKLNVRLQSIDGEHNYMTRLTEEQYIASRAGRCSVYYQYNYNGGLIFHRNVHGSPINGSWSIHT